HRSGSGSCWSDYGPLEHYFAMHSRVQLAARRSGCWDSGPVAPVAILISDTSSTGVPSAGTSRPILTAGYAEHQPWTPCGHDGDGVTPTRMRQSRRIANPGGRAIRPQERDRWLITALGKMRFLTTSQIAQLGFGGSRWSAN